MDRQRHVLLAALIGAFVGVGALTLFAVGGRAVCGTLGQGCGLEALLVVVVLYPVVVWVSGWLLLRAFGVVRPQLTASVGTVLTVLALFLTGPFGLTDVVVAPAIAFTLAALVVRGLFSPPTGGGPV